MADNSLINILIVEDEPSIHHSLAGFLEDFDFNVLVADSAEKALGFMSKKSFHAAIVDIRLPGMNGDVFILEAHKIIPKTRFIIYTGSTDYHLSNELKHIGVKADHVFFKPQRDLSVFVKTIQELLAESRDKHDK